MFRKTKICCVLSLMTLFTSCSQSDSTVSVSQQGETESVLGVTDDCAIWIQPTDRSLSLIIGNDRRGEGGLYGWDLNGKVVFYYGPLVKPVNLDLRYGFKLGNETVDILVVGTHVDNTLHVFKVDPQTRALEDITVPGGIQTHVQYQLYSLSLYQNIETKNVYAFVSQGKSQEALLQILLEDAGNGKVKGSIVRTFGEEYIQGIVKGMYVDDELDYLYCCDQRNAVLKFHADPKLGNELVGRFATADGIEGDRDAIALYRCPDGKGYLLLSCHGHHQIKMYDREGDNPFIMTVHKKGEAPTDGIEVTSCELDEYPHGFVICHNPTEANFVLYNWDDIATDRLQKCTCSSGY